ncbi:MAG: hypothetical protein M1824_000362 [Vezdaea acicularis]|nr:MAG: hypothetical protein M1824_000362 [Vezdaea acicularis]
MATSAVHQGNGHGDNILRPRAMKFANAQILRTQSDENGLKPGNGIITPAQSSGRSTPVPQDAPPSVKSISSARKQIRDQRRHRLFPTVEYFPRVSHFDPESEYQDFRGFFSLFWIGLAIMVITSMLRNIKDTGYPMRSKIWALFTIDLWQLALADLAMVASTALALPLHYLYRRSNGLLRWKNGGMAFQSIFQAGWLVFWVALPFILDWTWTAQVYFTLHILTLLMKMHSYSFYNGHLNETQRRLYDLDNPAGASTASAYRYPSSRTGVREGGTEDADFEEKEKEKEEDDDDDDKKNDVDEKERIASLREDLAMELTSPLGHVTYPQNLNVPNYVDYILCPTLCYELEYPRTASVRWTQVLFKTLAVFGCIFLLTIISEEFILPVMAESALRLEDVHSLTERALILAESISMILFPFMITFLLVFLVIFEYVLGAFAEITRFADRQFYADWWNSVDWLEFSREWNIPVHHFFRRHVYGASRPHLSRPTATLVTFLISAVGHELVMACITKKMRGYGFLAQMTQLPIVMLQRTPWVRGKRVFNNVCFWCSMILGLSMMCSLYVLV